MDTVTDLMRGRAARLIEALDALQHHSNLYQWHDNRGSRLQWLGGNYRWNELPTDGRQAQSAASSLHRQHASLLHALFEEQPGDTLSQFVDADRVIASVIEQNDYAFHGNVHRMFSDAVQAVRFQIGLLERLYDGSGGASIAVPDTNALLYAPKLEAWIFEGVPKFRLLLTPTVLQELDELKIAHRNPDVREKAEKLIRQFKEYRRRGTLASGVPLSAGRSEIASIAVEPNATKVLPWLDPGNSDDRLLASTIATMRQAPRSTVFLVTRDINLQNKAEHAGVPFVEVPEVA